MKFSPEKLLILKRINALYSQARPQSFVPNLHASVTGVSGMNKLQRLRQWSPLFRVRPRHSSSNLMPFSGRDTPSPETVDPILFSGTQYEVQEWPCDNLQVQILKELVPLWQHFDTLKTTFENSFCLEVHSLALTLFPFRDSSA